MTGFCAHGVRLDHECTACVTTPLPPHAVAQIDQSLAELTDQISYMVRMFRRYTPEKGDVQATADLAATVCATYDPIARGELVAAAVRMLAAAEGDRS